MTFCLKVCVFILYVNKTVKMLCDAIFFNINFADKIKTCTFALAITEMAP